MTENRIVKWIIGLCCVALLAVIAGVAIFLDSRSDEPILGIFKDRKEDQTQATEPAQDKDPADQENQDPTEPSEEHVQPPEDLPSNIEIPVVTDPVTGESQGVQLPYEIEEYGLVIQKMDPYEGLFVEDGTNVQVENVAMLLVENRGDFPVEYTQICVDYQGEKLYFDISALPVGEKLVVQEKNGKAIPQTEAGAANALIVQRADMAMSEDQVRVTDNGNNTLTVTNLTDKTIPTVRVFYKYYMEDGDIFVGGIAFTVKITRLNGGGSVTIQPSHYTSSTSRVVMVLTYDSEV